jgi:hypothetical protein
MEAAPIGELPSATEQVRRLVPGDLAQRFALYPLEERRTKRSAKALRSGLRAGSFHRVDACRLEYCHEAVGQAPRHLHHARFGCPLGIAR